MRCPMNEDWDCLEEKCAWWLFLREDLAEGHCAVASLVIEVHGLRQEVEYFTERYVPR